MTVKKKVKFRLRKEREKGIKYFKFEKESEQQNYRSENGEGKKRGEIWYRKEKLERE